MKAIITITQDRNGNVVLTGEGDFDFATEKDSVVARAAMAAVDAASAIVDAEGEFSDPLVTGDDAAVAMSNIKNAKRIPHTPESPKIRWLSDTQI